LSWLRRLLSRGLTRGAVEEAPGVARRVRLLEDEDGDRFVLIVWLMVLFFAGLILLELVHMVWVGSWNDAVFNGIMLVVGTIVGAVWGKMSG